MISCDKRTFIHKRFPMLKRNTCTAIYWGKSSDVEGQNVLIICLLRFYNSIKPANKKFLSGSLTAIYFYFTIWSPGGGGLPEMALGKLSSSLSPSIPHSGLWKNQQTFYIKDGCQLSRDYNIFFKGYLRHHILPLHISHSHRQSHSDLLPQRQQLVY